ncbi:TRAP transporter small permease subunit [Halomonas halocynthiae]|uniref:TRAP transporter small permease subunit n=1 Tax=Halomonas halocynthiae TaxID=176290 RepID=UPI0003FFA0FF|nr:TRAP transporter small permease subunit [Halomonas halocynthiae]
MHGLITRLCGWVLNFCGICLLLIAFVIGAGVLMHLMGASQLVEFETPYWLLGSSITFNSLMGLQVLLFTFAMMLAVAPVMWLDRHVKVDVLHARLSSRYRGAIELAGHLLFGIPFFVLLLLPAYRFAERAYVTGERSTDGGLADIYVIKSALPVGVTLFLAVLVLIVAISAWRWATGRQIHA